VDVIVGGRHHEKMANIVKGMVIQSGFENGQSLSFSEFFFDGKGNLLPEKTVVHQPVLICHDFFKETKDCYWEDPSVDHTKRVAARFLGQEVKPDDKMREKFKKFFVALQATPVKNHETQHLLKAFSTDIVLTPSKNTHSQLVTIEINGGALEKILEEKFNAGETSGWAPTSFVIQEKKLKLEIAGRPLERDRNYKILSDLETLQSDFELKPYINHSLTRTHTTLSWNELDFTDEVNSSMASTQRQ